MNVVDDNLPPLPSVPPAGPISESPAVLIPWEAGEGNWLSRWWDTLTMAMCRPRVFFTAVRHGRRIDLAILFFSIGLAVDSVIAPLTTGRFEDSILHSAWNRLSRSLPNPTGFDGLNEDGELDLSRLLPNGLPPGQGGRAGERSGHESEQIKSISDLASGLAGVLRVVSCALSIMFGFVSLFATAALFQAGAWLFIPRRRAFADTLRTVAYAHAPLVWSLVPMVGGLVFFVWLSVLIVVGLRIVHETTKTRVVAALSFWPGLVLLTVGLGCALILRQVLPVVNSWRPDSGVRGDTFFL